MYFFQILFPCFNKADVKMNEQAVVVEKSIKDKIQKALNRWQIQRYAHGITNTDANTNTYANTNGKIHQRQDGNSETTQSYQTTTIKLPDVPLVPRVIWSPIKPPKSEFWDLAPLRPPKKTPWDPPLRSSAASSDSVATFKYKLQIDM